MPAHGARRSRLLGWALVAIAAVAIVGYVVASLLGHAAMAAEILTWLMWFLLAATVAGLLVALTTRKSRARVRPQVRDSGTTINALLLGHRDERPPARSADEYSAHPPEPADNDEDAAGRGPGATRSE